jgi:hypothetical protein
MHESELPESRDALSVVAVEAPAAHVASPGLTPSSAEKENAIAPKAVGAAGSEILGMLAKKAAHVKEEKKKKKKNNKKTKAGAVMKKPSAAAKTPSAVLKKPGTHVIKPATSPSLSVERSRCQVMLRNGQEGAGTTYTMRFPDYGGEGKALKKARAWLESERKTYTGGFDMVM